MILGYEKYFVNKAVSAMKTHQLTNGPNEL